jgi:hypothetical protein
MVKTVRAAPEENVMQEFTMNNAKLLGPRTGLGITLIAGASLLAGCLGPVEVGDAMPDDGPSDSATGGTSAEPVGCGDADARARAPYDAWRGQSNDFGELAGTVFRGYLEGGDDLTLTVGVDGAATLLVGEAAASAVADQGYLCVSEGNCAEQTTLASGATYPVYGATFEDGRLRLPVQSRSAYEPWCTLQEPNAWDDCLYAIRPNVEISWGETCHIGEDEVDCGYFSLVQYPGPCTCTSVECFAGIMTTTSNLLLDLRLDGDQLDGSLGSTNVHLSRDSE